MIERERVQMAVGGPVDQKKCDEWSKQILCLWGARHKAIERRSSYRIIIFEAWLWAFNADWLLISCCSYKRGKNLHIDRQWGDAARNKRERSIARRWLVVLCSYYDVISALCTHAESLCFDSKTCQRRVNQTTNIVRRELFACIRPIRVNDFLPFIARRKKNELWYIRSS